MKIKLFLREIRVVPVIVEAESVEKAQELIREGDGEYLNDQSYPSALSVDDLLDNIFEDDAEIIPEKKLEDFKRGDAVTATPHNGDFEHEFMGTVTGFRIGTVQVTDMEGDTFDCYPFQLEKGWI